GKVIDAAVKTPGVGGIGARIGVGRGSHGERSHAAVRRVRGRVRRTVVVHGVTGDDRVGADLADPVVYRAARRKLVGAAFEAPGVVGIIASVGVGRRGHVERAYAAVGQERGRVRRAVVVHGVSGDDRVGADLVDLVVYRTAGGNIVGAAIEAPGVVVISAGI